MCRGILARGLKTCMSGKVRREKGSFFKRERERDTSHGYMTMMMGLFMFPCYSLFLSPLQGYCRGTRDKKNQENLSQ